MFLDVFEAVLCSILVSFCLIYKKRCVIFNEQYTRERKICHINFFPVNTKVGFHFILFYFCVLQLIKNFALRYTYYKNVSINFSAIKKLKRYF